SELPRLNWAGPAPVTAADLPKIAGKARALASKYPGAAATALSSFVSKLEMAHGPAGDALARRLTQWQEVFVEQVRSALEQFHPSDLDISKLPPELKSHYVGTDGSFALYLYPRANLWEQAN